MAEVRRTRFGAEIDSAIADSLAAEAECGYGLSRAKRRRLGRLPLGVRRTSPRSSAGRRRSSPG